MTSAEFGEAVRRSLPPGVEFENPGGGTSRVSAVTDSRISYTRGSSTIHVSIEDLFRAYDSFRGGWMSSTDLREFAPEVFDSSARPSGHSCNCTFLFLMLQEMGLAGPIEGRGVRGDPYAVEVR